MNSLSVDGGSTGTVNSIILAQYGGQFSGTFSTSPATMNVTNITASYGTMVAQYVGGIELYGITFGNVTGAAGPRYKVTMNGLIETYGGGTTFIPGSSSGATATGGQYE